MERTKPSKKPDAILTSDWHLRETQPTCRTDDFWRTQWTKVDFVRHLQQEHNCPVFHAGDLFHHWKPSPQLLSYAIACIPDEFYTIYGQHDLPQHNWEARDKSGIWTMETARTLKTFKGVHWGQEPDINKLSIKIHHREVLVWHKMVWQGKRLWPGQKDPSTIAVLKKYPEYDLILTGDNHKTFVEEYGKQILVNPGSLTRQKADQIDHKPCVFLYYASDNSVVPHYIPITDGVVQRNHIDKEDARKERINAYIERLHDDWEIEFSFEKNLERFFSTNKIRKNVQKLVQTAIEQK